MAHIKHGTEKSRFSHTPPEWLDFGAQVADQVNEWSGRSDIVAFVGDGAGQGVAAACFLPELAEVEVNVTACFGEGYDPAFIGDITDRAVQFDHPATAGALLHEAFHAKHSLTDFREMQDKVLKKDRDSFAYTIITDFEETRIEARGVQAFPENVPFLRACALKLSIGDISEDKDFAARGHQAMTKLMLLTLARVDAGVLKPEDVEPIAAAAETLYGEELLGKLRGIWIRAQGVRNDHDWRSLYKLAKEWIDLLEKAGHAPRDEGKAPEWLKELLKAMIGAGESGGEGGEPGEGGILVMMSEETEVSARDDVADQDAKEQAEAAAEARGAEAKEEASHKSEASDVFGRGTGPGSGNTRSRLQQKRAPKGPERAAAVRLAKDLEKARYRDRVVEHKKTAMPPGKLRMRSAMAGEVELRRGGVYSQEPWNSKRRYHTEDPELKVGVMVDISGSMRAAMEPMAVTAWVLSEAVKRVQGKAAMVYYGNSVFPVLAPGQHLDEVNVYSAPDGTEKFDKGFKALDGQLGLLRQNGARLLVVVSDLYHTSSEIKAAERWFTRCRQAGVAVVVVAPSAEMVVHARSKVGTNGTVLELKAGDPAGTAAAIGAAAVAELTRASQ